jgi:hypothetical protein
LHINAAVKQKNVYLLMALLMLTVWLNRSFFCISYEAVSVKYECVCLILALVIQYANCTFSVPYYIVCHLWLVWHYHVFPNYLINGMIFGGKKFIEHKTSLLIVSATYT